MELVYLERRNGLFEENATPEFSGRSETSHQHLPIVSPEVHSDLGLINYKQPLPSNEKKSMSCQSCHKPQCSCSSNTPYPELYPTLPAKMMILEFLIRSLRHPRRTHNVSDLDDMISDGASTGSVVLGPSEKMMLDSLHALVDAKTRPKSPSFFHPGAKMRKTRSSIITQSEILKLISPETWETCSRGASPLNNNTSELRMHEKMVPSCLDTSPISSNQPALPSHTSSLSAGLLQCTWKEGLPHFELSLDNPMVVYTANLVKALDNDKSLDYVYLIHSGEQGRKDWIGNPCNVSWLVGKMKVSSSLVLNSDKSTSMETEFVLYGSPDDYLRQMQIPYSATKGKGLAKRVADIMKPANLNSSPKHVWKFGKSYSHQLDDLTEVLDGEQYSTKQSGLKKLDDDDLPTNQEIAAIVVKELRREKQKELIVGGWGLKFLQKAGDTHPEGSEDADVHNHNRRGSARCVTAILPRGYHGGVVSKNGGPTGLIERWRSGGHCDCGGWDLGCPIRVLENNGCGSSPQAESQDSKSMELSIKGVNKNEPMLRLVNITDDLHVIYFDSSLSALDSFCTGIAILHSQAPQLHPEL